MTKKEKKILLKLTIFFIILLFSFILGNNISYENNTQTNFYKEEITKDNNIDNRLQIHFIDVGQGDCILIKNKEYSMLIDAGNNEYGNKVVEYIKREGIDKLTYIVGTHGDSDHIGGLDTVINNIEFDEVYFPKQIKTTKTYIDFIQSVKNKNKKISLPKINEVIQLGDAKITILWPQENKEYEDSNDYSIVLKLDYYNNSFLFTGDAGTNIEKRIIENNQDLKCDLIKIGHHGSTSSTSDEFLRLVNPKYAVISVGQNNDYNHPSKKVIDRLNKYNIQIHRTDLEGNIVVYSDGNNITFRNEVKNDSNNR